MNLSVERALGSVVKRQVGVEPVLAGYSHAAVVVPVGVREGIQRAVHRHEAVELVLLKFGCIADNDGGGQRPAQQDDVLQTEMVDELLDVLRIAADGVALAGLGGVALSAGSIVMTRNSLERTSAFFFRKNLVVHKKSGDHHDRKPGTSVFEINVDAVRGGEKIICGDFH